mmetsp:Transcript_33582/g.33034  ORF Transcript_33582/g.33034 Transcript_33582/m.33034 type:complete len:97 (-) Transcript_33582:108-398(-)
MNRENTPWIDTASFYPTFENKKDAFIEKYQVLLDYQEMLEKRISGKVYKNQNKSKPESQTLSLIDQKPVNSIMPDAAKLENLGSDINSKSIDETAL